MHGRDATGVGGVDDVAHARCPPGRKAVPPYIRVRCAGGGPGRERGPEELPDSLKGVMKDFRIFGGGAAPKISESCVMGDA